MSGIKCPECKHTHIVTEKRFNGNSTCKNCGFAGPTAKFHFADEKVEDVVKPLNEEMLKDIAEAVETVFPGQGFVIMTFVQDGTNEANFISNCKRSSSIKALRELADRLEVQELTKGTF